MSSLTGTWHLARLALRRDRVRLPVWLLAITGLVYGSAQSVQGLYATAEQIASYGTTMGSSPAAIMLSGPPTALDTIGGITVYEINTTALVATALMAVFGVVRHTRGEEEAGRTELVRSAVTGRHSTLMAAAVVLGAASLLLGALVGLAFVGVGLEASSAALYAATVAGTGLAFTAVGACAAQVTSSARGALGISSAVVAGAFVLRGLGDVGDGTLSWFSPFGWVQAARPFGDERWWPLLAAPVFAAAVLGVAAWLNNRRDAGAGLVQPRPGPARGTDWLGTAFGLAARLQKGSIIGWTAGMFVGGLVLGSFGREVTTMVEDNPDLAEVFQASGASVLDSFFSLAMLIVVLIATGFTVSSVQRLRAEEEAGRLEPLLATALTRTRWLLGSLGVTVLGTVLVMGVGGLGAGIAQSLVSGDSSWLPRLLGAALVHVPAALVVGAVAALLVGWLPRLTGVTWAALAFCVVVGYLGGLLDLPAWSTDASPFSHVPSLPAEAMRAAPLLVLSAVAVGGALLGLLGLRRRDLT